MLQRAEHLQSQRSEVTTSGARSGLIGMLMTKPWLLVAYLTIFAISLDGCVQQKAIIGGSKAPKTYKAIVSLAPGITEILALTGGKFVGRTESDDYPTSVKMYPVVTNGVHPDFEKITALKADLAIYDTDLTSAADLQKLQEAKVDTYGFGPMTVAEYEDDLYKLGAKLGLETMLNDNVAGVRKAVRDAAADPITPQPKVAILLPFPGSNPMIAGTKSFYADLVRVAGGLPVGPPDTKFVTIGMEQLTQLDPDIIIVGGAKGDYSSLTKDQALSNLRAVKKGKYFGVDPAVLERRGVRVDKAVQNIHTGLKLLSK